MKSLKMKLIYRKHKKAILGTLGAVLLAGLVFFFSYFHVTKVEVMGTSRYTDEQVKEMALQGAFTDNSVLAVLLHSRVDVEGVPFVEGFYITRLSHNSICISVREKKAVGCIPYLDSYIYFDNNGYFVEGSKIRDTKVAFFDGIQPSKIVMKEKLPIKGAVLNTAVALSTIFAKNDKVPDHISFDDNYEISLMYGDVTVQLGKDEYLEDKMTRAIAILPQLEGQKGILHMENISRNSKMVTFEAEEEEITAENWNGGYDENGDYTGDGEYDESGKYVGPKPVTALDTAIENWVGGYDEEGDYTGSGEYDADLNYIGPAPTQELLDSFGDWTGGYNEAGGFDGVGEYDAEGNYVGAKPEDTEDNSDTDNEDGSSQEEDSEEESTENTGDDSYEDGYSEEESDYYEGEE